MSIPRALPEVHVFDHGTILSFEVRNGRNQRVDISSAIVLEILFMRPDGSGFAAPAFLGMAPGETFPGSDSGTVPGTDGDAFYIIEPGQIDTEGTWYLQLRVVFTTGQWFSSVITFVVMPNLITPSEILNP